MHAQLEDHVFFITKNRHIGLFNFIERGNYRSLISAHQNVFQEREPDHGIEDLFIRDFVKNIVAPLLVEYSAITCDEAGRFSTQFARIEVQDPHLHSKLLLNSLEYPVRDLIREAPPVHGSQIKNASAYIKKTCSIGVSIDAINDIRRGFDKLNHAPNVSIGQDSCTLEFALVGIYEDKNND